MIMKTTMKEKEGEGKGRERGGESKDGKGKGAVAGCEWGRIRESGTRKLAGLET